MTFYWIYDLTNLQLAMISCGVCITYTWLGVILVGNALRRHTEDPAGIGDFVGQYLSALGLFFGLMLGLVAVASYENYGAAETAVSVEANQVAGLYRTVSAYPPPYRQQLQGAIYDYVDYVVEDAWPQYRRGVIPTDGPARVSAIQVRLFAVQPTRTGDQLVHAEALRQFSGFTEATRNRLEFVNTGLPSMLWLIVMIGAAMTLALLWFITNDLLWVRLTASGVLAIYVGLMMFFIAAMDHPLRGAYSISPDALVDLRTMIQAYRGAVESPTRYDAGR